MVAMEQRGISIMFLCLSAIFYIMAFGLAFGAESRRNTVVVKHDESVSFCSYRVNGATGLAGAACVLLFLAQGIIMAMTRCLCYGPSLEAKEYRLPATLLFGLSWLCFVISEILLVAGAKVNSIQTKATGMPHDGLDCSRLRKGVFTSAGAFTLFTMILSEAYFVFVLKARGEPAWQPSMNSSVGMTSI